MDIWRHAGGPATVQNICLYVELKCVTTIYLLSLLFLCHCDLDFDVKEDEKSTLIKSCDKKIILSPADTRISIRPLINKNVHSTGC